MPKKFASVEERRAYWKQWYENNKHREDYKAYDRATKKRIRKERVEWFQEFKKTLKCNRCGIQDFRVLDLHHRDPSQKDDEVANLAQRGLSIKKILAEIAKCDCLCANCHRIVHWEEKESGIGV
jgi:hypothetical protein